MRALTAEISEKIININYLILHLKKIVKNIFLNKFTFLFEKIINKTLSTVNNKALFRKYIFYFSLIFIIFLNTGNIIKSIFATLFFTHFIFSLANYLKQKGFPSRKRVIRYILEFSKVLRNIFTIGKDVELLISVMIFFIFCWMTTIILNTSNINQSNIVYLLIFTPLIIAGSIDSTRIVNRIYKFTWVKFTGKVFYATITAISIYLGNLYSKKIVIQSTGFPIDSFPETEVLINLVLTPLIFFLLVTSILSITAIIVCYTGIISLMLINVIQDLIWSSSTENTTDKIVKKKKILIRLRYGRNPTKKELQTHRWGTLINGLRYMAVIFVAAGFINFSIRFMEFSFDNISPLVRDLVVKIDFNQNQRCGTTFATELLKNLKNEKMLVAIKEDNDWTFKDAVCQNGKIIFK